MTDTLHHHNGYDLHVIERMRVDHDRLIYKHEITGPGDKRDQREIVFQSE